MSRRVLRSRRRILFAFLGVVLLGVLVVAVILARADVRPLTAGYVHARIDLVNDGAGVVVPHKRLDDGATRGKHLSLFEKVEAGVVLTDAESREYRTEYQGILQRKQVYLRRFDGNLTVLESVGMNRPNNVGGNGIEGAHDHHDASARSNAGDVVCQLERLESGGKSLRPRRVLLAIGVNKDLMDILLHMATAPQTKSVTYSSQQIDDPVSARNEVMIAAFKDAQFEAVNSPAYWRGVHRALDEYERLVLEVQQRLDMALTPLERRLAGRWGDWQSVGPSFFDGYPQPRPSARRNRRGPHGDGRPLTRSLCPRAGRGSG